MPSFGALYTGGKDVGADDLRASTNCGLLSYPPAQGGAHEN